MTLYNTLKRIDFTIDNLRKSGIELSELKKKSLDEFKDRKKKYYLDFFKTNLELLQNQDADDNTIKIINSLDLDDLNDFADKIKKLLTAVKDPEKNESFLNKELRSKIPNEIREDVKADLEELSKCFDLGCYRSSAILCGRMLEVALHWKYYKATGIDLLEKSPGIGLGKIVAKLSEKNIELDPGLSQQIHLINQVRIFSVHVKQNAFNPNKNQAHAMILYTVDILDKLFSR